MVGLVCLHSANFGFNTAISLIRGVENTVVGLVCFACWFEAQPLVCLEGEEVWSD